ncbi:Mycophenolic acid synthesis protein B [Hypsizygus marmoreus]|uniref:Mycophenolic acid synthesis protein B n=1 Tax=Hypsizygus marmoreus TaxID=39966 RepID=A0A369KCZ5_HYPMA|nr:Mycophenolic acid synthesis protein B [Hypsizygus marmoreus]
MLRLLCCFASYLLVVRILRYRRVNAIRLKFSHDELANMTPWTAQQVVHESFLYDTPTLMLLGTQIALFKVYGISSVASLLLRTGEMTSHTTINKRLADTAILIATSVTNPLLGPGSGIEQPPASCDPRSALAIARINFLHRKYPISNDDFLYNLALFMIEPIRWTARFDWRPHSPLEVEAIFLLWTEVGRRMGIENIWSTYEEMREWTERYETENMVPSDASAQLAWTTIEHFLDRVPNWVPGFRSLIFQLLLTVLDDRTRNAMRLPDPSPIMASFIYSMFKIRAFVVRHLCLPRSKPALWVTLDSDFQVSDGVPRMRAVYRRRSGPWYFPEPKGMALKIQTLFIRLGIIDAEKAPGKRWRSGGYRLEEVGPIKFEKEGHDIVMREAEKIQGSTITGPWGPVQTS